MLPSSSASLPPPVPQTGHSSSTASLGPADSTDIATEDSESSALPTYAPASTSAEPVPLPIDTALLDAADAVERDDMLRAIALMRRQVDLHQSNVQFLQRMVDAQEHRVDNLERTVRSLASSLENLHLLLERQIVGRHRAPARVHVDSPKPPPPAPPRM